MEDNKDLKSAIFDFNKTAHQLKKQVRRDARENEKLITNVAKDLKREVNETFLEYKKAELTCNEPGSKDAIAKARREKIEIKREINSDEREIRREIREEADYLLSEINLLRQSVNEAAISNPGDICIEIDIENV